MNCSRRSDRSSRSIKRPIRRQDIFVCPRCLINYSMPTIGDLRNTIIRGETTARAMVESALNSADKLNEQLNAFLEIDREGALKPPKKTQKTPQKTPPAARGHARRYQGQHMCARHADVLRLANSGAVS